VMRPKSHDQEKDQEQLFETKTTKYETKNKTDDAKF